MRKPVILCANKDCPMVIDCYRKYSDSSKLGVALYSWYLSGNVIKCNDFIDKRLNDFKNDFEREIKGVWQ